MTTWYITKYALTQGIIEVHEKDGWKLIQSSKGTVYLTDNRMHLYVLGQTAHRTFEEAVERAEVMRANAIKSAENKIKKLHWISFTSTIPW